jgi:hypothetical protein
MANYRGLNIVISLKQEIRAAMQSSNATKPSNLEGLYRRAAASGNFDQI